MKSGIQAITALVGLLVTLPALGQEAAPPAPAPAETAPATASPPPFDPALRKQQLDAEYQKQAARRSAAKGSFVLGGVVIGAGLIASAIKTADDCEEAEEEAYENGDSEYTCDLNIVPFVIGAAIGVPIIVANIGNLRDANRRIRDINRERLSVSVVPEAGGATTLALRYEF